MGLALGFFLTEHSTLYIGIVGAALGVFIDIQMQKSYKKDLDIWHRSWICNRCGHHFTM